MVFTNDVSQLISTGREIVVWDLASRSELRRLETSALSLALSPDGETLACGSNKSVTLVNLKSGEKEKVLAGFSGSTYGLAFSPDGKLFAAASLDGAVRIWNVKDGKRIQTLQGHTSAAYRVQFSNDGKLLISVGGDYSQGSAIHGDAKVWQVSNWKEVTELRGHLTAVTDVAMHPKDSRVATIRRLLNNAAEARNVPSWQRRQTQLLQKLVVPRLGISN